MKNFHTPDRMVLAGVGMEHQLLVDLAKEQFCNVNPIWSEQQHLIDPKKSTDNSISQYTGGKVLVSKNPYQPTQLIYRVGNQLLPLLLPTDFI